MIEIARLADALNARAESLAADLLPNGKRRGREWTVGSLAGEPGKSLSVSMSGARRGRWKDFASGDGGDMLDLVAGALCGGSKADAIQWAKQWLGLDTAGPAPVLQRPAAPPRPSPEIEARQRAEAQEQARRKFAGCQHRIAGTGADWYLRGRAIDLRQLGRQPGRLAFHPGLWCEETRDRRPAMVAAIVQAGRIVGIHRTYLAETVDDAGEVTWRKAELECPKKTLGPWTGGCIPLWRGMDKHAWRDLFEKDEDALGPQSVTLTEGIEDALSIAIADPSRRVAAAVSLAGLAGVVLPPCVKDVVLAADNDPGAAQQAALQRAVEAHSRCGRRVLVARAPAPHKDFNEWLQTLTSTGTSSGTGSGSSNGEFAA